MTAMEDERLAEIIRERTKPPIDPILELNEAKAFAEKLAQARRQFDKKYPISTPRVLIGL